MSLAAPVQRWALRAIVVLATVEGARVSPAAELLVTDQAGNRILAFDADNGAYLRTLWSAPTSVQPAGLTFGPGGDLYVVNLKAHEVLRIAKADLGKSNVTATPFITGITGGPGSIAYYAPSNQLLVGEFGHYGTGDWGDEIFVYDATGVRQSTLAMPPVGVSGLAFDSAGNLYANGFRADETGIGRLYRFAGPAWQAGGVTPLTEPWGFFLGSGGVGADSAGHVYAAGLISQFILRFTIENGVVVDQQPLGGEIPFPSGVYVLNDQQLLTTSLGFPDGGVVFRVNSATGARTPILLGDFNRGAFEDRIVNGNDLATWVGAFEMSGAADADIDGDSDGNDFLAWQRGVGNAGPPGVFSPSGVVVYDPANFTSIPEPESAALTIGACAAVAAIRRRVAGVRGAAAT